MILEHLHTTRRRLTALVGAALLFAAPVGAAEIATATGPAEVPDAPQTLAVFDIAAIDTLTALGVTIAGVPDKLYLPALGDKLGDAEVVGTLFEPDLEALSALGPDLVVVGGRSSPQLEAVRQVAPAIDMTIGDATLLAEAKARIASYGALFGKADAATALTARVDDALARARAAIAGKGTGLIVMTNGPKVTAYGAGSRFGWIHDDLALPAAAASVTAANHGEAISFEFIAEANPDWLIVVDRAAAIGTAEQNARATLDNELVHGTTAWRKGQVIYLPAAEAYIAGGGATSLLHVLDVIAAAFAGAA